MDGNQGNPGLLITLIEMADDALNFYYFGRGKQWIKMPVFRLFAREAWPYNTQITWVVNLKLDEFFVFNAGQHVTDTNDDLYLYKDLLLVQTKYLSISWTQVL